MGRLIDGKWTTEWYQADEKGRFVRDATVFHGRVSADGSSGFAAAEGRYHLYVSYACPWAHRTLIVRRLKRLDDVISISVVHPYMGEDGWSFDEAPGTIADPIHHAKFLRDVYVKANPRYTGRVTVPVLWDKERSTIVCNESREIIRMLDHEFNAFGDADVDLCPPALKDLVEQRISEMYEPVNNGVYRAGFAKSQEAYDEAVTQLFSKLDEFDALLQRQRYLCGDTLTEADVCLFTTLLRFDLVYHYHFKCNVRRIQDYPSLFDFTKALYQLPGIADTCHFDHIKQHYFRSHPSINPYAIVPRGPTVSFDGPHARARFG